MSTAETGGVDPGRALAFVAGYPDCLIGSDLEPTDSRLETAYEFGFRDLGRAIRDVRNRREMVQGLYDHLTVDSLESTPFQPTELILMLEAFHNSFPDEAGELDRSLDMPAWNGGRPLEVKSTDPAEFRGTVSKFLDQAGTLEGAITATNDDNARILLFREPDGRVTEFDMIAGEGPARREIVVRHTPSACYMKHQVEYMGGGRQYDWEMKIAEESGRLEGLLFNNGAKRIMDETRTVDAINHMLDSLARELAIRQETASIDDAL